MNNNCHVCGKACEFRYGKTSLDGPLKPISLLQPNKDYSVLCDNCYITLELTVKKLKQEAAAK